MWYWHIPHQYNEHCLSSPDPSESSVYAQRRLRRLVTTSLPLPTDSVSVVSARSSCVVSILFTDKGRHGPRSPDSSNILKHVAAVFKIENHRNYKVMLLYSLVGLRPPRSRPTTTHLNQHMVTAIASDFRHLPTLEMPASLVIWFIKSW